MSPDSKIPRARIRLRVKPGARSDAIVGFHGDALKLSVTAPPEKGKANRAVIVLLAETLGVSETSVSIVAGETSRDKVALVPLTEDEARSRLASALSAFRASGRGSGSSA